MLILAFLFKLFLNPTEVIALQLAACDYIVYDIGDGAYATKWSCPHN